MKDLPPDLITIEQAADQLGVSPWTISRLIREDNFPPAIRVGRQWRISVPKLERYKHGEQQAATG